MKILVCINNVQHCFFIFFGPIFQVLLRSKECLCNFINTTFAEAARNSCVKSARFPVIGKTNRTFLLKDPGALEKTCTLGAFYGHERQTSVMNGKVELNMLWDRRMEWMTF